MMRSQVPFGLIVALTLGIGCGGQPAPSDGQDDAPSPGTVVAVTIDGGPRTMLVGDVLDLDVSVDVVGGAATTVTWSSSDDGIATVNADGRVAGVAPGTISIKAVSTADASKRSEVVLTVFSSLPRVSGLPGGAACPGTAWTWRNDAPVALTPSVRGARLAVEEGPIELILHATHADGSDADLTMPGPTIRVPRDGQLDIVAEGLQPASVAGLWSFSEPLHVGAAAVTDSGDLEASFARPPDAAPGLVTVVLLAFDAAGTERALAFGIERSATGGTMTLRVDTRSISGRTVTLPLRGSVDVSVDWGDGTSTTTTSAGDLDHTYAADGTFTITIEGALSRFGNGPAGFPNAAAITEVTTWSGLGLISLAGAFYGAQHLQRVPDQLPSSVTNLAYAFAGASTFSQAIGDWDVSSVRSLVGTFAGASSFDGAIGSWDTSNVTDMSAMFQRATAFDRDLDTWDTSKVTDMRAMFGQASSFNRDLDTWDTSNVESMRSMFRGATSFDGAIGSWDTSNVESMAFMFEDATAFNRDLDSWDTGNVADMTAMFQGATAFNRDLEGWNTGNVTDMSNMFDGASRFNGAIGTWDTSNVTDIRAMFQRATAFNRDLDGWNTGSVTRMGFTFNAAAAFDGDIGSWDTSNVTDMTAMFDGASRFNGAIGIWDTSNVTDMTAMFQGASAFDRDLSGWCVTLIEDEPAFFDAGATSWDALRPVWGTCPTPP